MFNGLSPVYAFLFWGLVAICPDWWPFPRFPRPPIPWPPPPPPPWKVASVVVGIAAAFVITRALPGVESAGMVEFVLSGVFALAGARATLSLGAQFAGAGAKMSTDVGNP